MMPNLLTELLPHIKEVTLVETLVDFLRIVPKGVFPQYRLLLQLYLTVPFSNATSERSFSALRRLKTYLRTRMNQETLNHAVILHVHKHELESINMDTVMKNFIRINERRKNYFGGK